MVRLPIRTLLAMLLLSAVTPLFGQGSEGPILLPQARPTLLLICDLACDLQIDGEPKGHLDAGASRKITATLGQHLIEAATTDGLDRASQELDLKSATQRIVHLNL